MFYIFFVFVLESCIFNILHAVGGSSGGGFVEIVIKFRSNCSTFHMPNNSICPLQPGDFVNTCEIKLIALK